MRVANYRSTALYARTNVERVYNHYGPTEATTCATVAPLPRGFVGKPPIGMPIAGARVYVLDANNRLAETGETGEICIAGPTVALGYLGNADYRGSAFVPDPFAPTERMYRTGDLGRRTVAGDLEFLGRMGDQVKVRGFRIELGEIEAALLRLPKVRQAAAVVRTDGSRHRDIVAFVVGEGVGPVVDIKRELAHWLPAHALPSQIRIVSDLPRGPAGKLDRLALRDISKAPEPRPAKWLPPMEEAICSIFRSCLGVTNVDLDDDFFALGGDSLRAASATVRIEAMLARPVPLPLFAQHSTPRRLATVLRNAPLKETDILVALNGVSEGVPLICLPDFHGRPISFMSLADGLDRPVWGLSPQPIRADIVANPDIVILTSAFRDAIRQKWPDGPYLVAGYSLGTALALDLARTLEKEGAEVRLMLVDGPNEVHRPSLGYALRWAVREGFELMRQGRPFAVARTICHSRFLFRHWLFPNQPVTDREIPAFVPPNDRELARAIVQAVRRRKPGAYSGAAYLVRCQRHGPRASFLDDDGMLGWRGYLPRATTQIVVPGTHHDMMREPFVAKLAAELEQALSST